MAVRCLWLRIALWMAQSQDLSKQQPFLNVFVGHLNQVQLTYVDTSIFTEVWNWRCRNPVTFNGRWSWLGNVSTGPLTIPVFTTNWITFTSCLNASRRHRSGETAVRVAQACCKHGQASRFRRTGMAFSEHGYLSHQPYRPTESDLATWLKKTLQPWIWVILPVRVCVGIPVWHMCTCILCTYCTHICLWAEMHPPSIKYLRHLSSLSGKFRVPRLFLSLTWCSQWFSMDTWNYITPPRNMGSHYVKTSCFPIFNQGFHPTIPSVLSERYPEGSSTKMARLSIATVDVSRIAAELKLGFPLLGDVMWEYWTILNRNLGETRIY